MKFINVKIENFLSVGQAELALADRGLLLIQGENKDDDSQNSNGAGKSSIVDALCWVLFGKTARGEAGDGVINRTAGKNTRVTLDIIDGLDNYSIVRHRKYTKMKNTLQVFQNEKDITKGTDKLTEDLVVKVIGCSYDVFRASIYAGQDDQIDLPKMTDKALKDIVEEAAGINKLADAANLAKQKLNERKAYLSGVEQKIFGNGMHMDSLSSNVELMEKEAIEFEESKKHKLSAAIEKKKFAQDKARDLIAQIKAFEITEVTERMNAIKKLMDKTPIFQEISARETLYFGINTKYQSLKSDTQKSVDEARALNLSLQELDKLVGEDCDSCGKKYHKEDLSAKSDSIKKKIMSEVADVTKNKPMLANFKKHLAAMSEELSALNEKTKQLPEHAEELGDLELQIKRYDTLKINASQCSNDIKNALERLTEIEKETNPHLSMIDRVKQDIESHVKENEILEESKVEAAKQVEIFTNVSLVYGLSGVRAHILETVTPQLNAKTMEYLSHLSDGNLSAEWNTLAETTKGELRENFHIGVVSKTGGESYRQLSGGEKRKVRLATNMALQDLVASRASKAIDLYIGDEIDHALDESGLERLMGVLEERAKVKGTVLVISHNELSDWIRESVLAIKENGFTRLEG